MESQPSSMTSKSIQTIRCVCQSTPSSPSPVYPRCSCSLSVSRRRLQGEFLLSNLSRISETLKTTTNSLSNWVTFRYRNKAQASSEKAPRNEQKKASRVTNLFVPPVGNHHLIGKCRSQQSHSHSSRHAGRLCYPRGLQPIVLVAVQGND